MVLGLSKGQAHGQDRDQDPAPDQWVHRDMLLYALSNTFYFYFFPDPLPLFYNSPRYDINGNKLQRFESTIQFYCKGSNAISTNAHFQQYKFVQALHSFVCRSC